MTITLKNDNGVIVYAFKRIRSYARKSGQIFVAQCVWWLAGLIGLEESLVKHIDNCNGLTIAGKEQGTKEVSEPAIQNTTEIQDSKDQGSKEDYQDKILKECEEYLKDSQRLRNIAALKATGKTLTGSINPTPISKKRLYKKDRSQRIRQTRSVQNKSKTAGIDEPEIQRRKEAGECLRCAWPSDRKGCHRVKDCIRPIKLDNGTVYIPKRKAYQKLKEPYQQEELEEASCKETSLEETSDDSL